MKLKDLYIVKEDRKAGDMQWYDPNSRQPAADDGEKITLRDLTGHTNGQGGHFRFVDGEASYDNGGKPCVCGCNCGCDHKYGPDDHIPQNKSRTFGPDVDDLKGELGKMGFMSGPVVCQPDGMENGDCNCGCDVDTDLSTKGFKSLKWVPST